MRKHVAICDRCGAETPLKGRYHYESIEEGGLHFDAPKGWERLAHRDLCPPCVKVAVSPPPEPEQRFADEPNSYRDSARFEQPGLQGACPPLTEEVATWKKLASALGITLLLTSPVWVPLFGMWLYS